MPKIVIREEHLRNPEDSELIKIRYESPAPCEGAVCGRAPIQTEEEFGELYFHAHIVASGENPKAAPRYYAFNFDDPFIHEPYHQREIFWKP